jgi:hypothetical protein
MFLIIPIKWKKKETPKKPNKPPQKTQETWVRKISFELKYAQNQRYITKCVCK